MQQVGPYQVVRELARGGMGVVYQARHPDGGEVAIKVLLPGGVGDPEQLLRFRREGEALLGLDHGGILRLQELGTHEGHPYLVMDLLQGPTLEQVVVQRGLPRQREVIAWGRRMAEALHHAHQQKVVHRDLKPANVILRNEMPVLVDFGLVRALDLEQSRLTETGSILGSPAYMAPEQALGEGDLGPASDVYALGAVLYYLLTGHAPFSGEGVLAILQQVVSAEPTPIRSFRPGVDPGLERLVQRCMSRDPAERYASAFQVAEALRGVAEQRVAPADRRGRVALLVSLGLALAGVGGLALTLGLRGDDSPPPEPTPPVEPVVEAPALDALAYLARARQHAADGIHEEAVADFDRALELEPEVPVEFYLSRAESLLELKRHARASEDYQRALELDPNDARVYAGRARLHAAEWRHAEAYRDYSRAIELGADQATIWAGRGAASLALKDMQAARADLDRALELDPTNVPARINSGVIHAHFGERQQALEDFDRAVSLEPENGLAYEHRASALTRLERHPEAIADFDRALRLGGGDPAFSYFTRGLNHFILEDYAAAIEDCKRALEVGGDAELVRKATALRQEALKKLNSRR